MTVRIRTITVDCHDPYLLAGFWSQVTGFADEPGNPNHPDDPEGLLLAPDGSFALLFIKVPEAKQVKNRIHFDVVPPSPDQWEDEVRRIMALGATLVDDRLKPDGTGWFVLADPEGNEFCVERFPAGE
jgi:hypothetical protein